MDFKKTCALLVLASGFILASCGGGTDDGGGDPASSSADTPSEREMAKRTAYTGEDDAEWKTEDAAHIAEEIKGAYNSGEAGTYLAGMSSADKASVLADIESWAKRNYILGIPLFGDGGWTLYSSRVQTPLSKTYVPNYGFGVLREGKLTSDLTAAQEPTEEYRSYLHAGLAEATAEINPFDSNDSTASDLLGYINGALYNQRLVKDGQGGYKSEYEWYPSLAIGEPTAVDLDSETNTAKTWRVKVKTGANSGLKFKTLSTKTINGTAVSSFNDRAVTVEDYIWGYRVALNGHNAYSYASQYAARFEGAAAYYTNSAETVVGSAADDELWANVGIKKVDDETIEIKTKQAYTPTNFKVYGFIDLCNEDFYKLVTGYGTDAYNPKSYGTSSTDGTLTPADTILSYGAYTLKKFSTGTGSDNEIVYVRNDDWVDKKAEDNSLYTIYQIPGVYIKVNSNYSGTNGTETKYQDWLAGKIDSAGIPSARKSEYTTQSPNVYVTANAAITALQVNSCTEARWNEVFGENGTNWNNPYQTDYTYDATKAAAYTVKPVMSNYNFLDGLYFSIDRATLADSLMAGRSADWVGEEYLVDLDSGVSYNETAAHKSAVADMSPDTYGYNKAVAQAKFEAAMNELVAQGKYTAGTSANPTEITISLQVAAQSQVTNWATKVKNYIEDAFNSVMNAKGFKLTVDLPSAPAKVSDIYGIMASGCYDLAWGGISGGTADTLSLFGCWLDDWVYGLQMSVGANPNVDSGFIHYNGYTFSASAMWYAVEAGEPVVITNGVFVGYPDAGEDAAEDTTSA